MNMWNVELRADGGDWAVVVFPPNADSQARVVYHSGVEGAAGVYRAEGVVEFLSARSLATEDAWRLSTLEWEHR